MIALAVGCFLLANLLLGVALMATLAEVSAKLDTVSTNVQALQAAIANAPTQAQVDALDAKATALVAASTPPTV